MGVGQGKWTNKVYNILDGEQLYKEKFWGSNLAESDVFLSAQGHAETAFDPYQCRFGGQRQGAAAIWHESSLLLPWISSIAGGNQGSGFLCIFEDKSTAEAMLLRRSAHWDDSCCLCFQFSPGARAATTQGQKGCLKSSNELESTHVSLWLGRVLWKYGKFTEPPR